MALKGFLLDLDGTLIDSNALHVEAWRRALEQHGYRVARDRLALEMGKGGDQLVTDVLGGEAEAEAGDSMRREHDRAYAELAGRDGILTLPRAKALLTALRARGMTTALVTSSGKEQLDVAEAASKVPWSDLVDLVVTGDDAERSKPAPDLVEVALRKLKLTASQCAMLGDTPWDAEAARAAGVAMIGLTFGGNSRARLRRAGARVVFRDVADLLSSLDEALRVTAPGTADLDPRTLVRLMREALVAAERGLEAGEVPIGSVIARGDGTIIARGHNRFNETRNKARHAEMDAFSAAAGKIPENARDSILVSTLEPCVMCTGAAMETAVDVIIYGLAAPADGGTRRVTPPESAESQLPRAVGGILANESMALLQRWLERPTRNREQEPYVKQLLASLKKGTDPKVPAERSP